MNNGLNLLTRRIVSHLPRGRSRIARRLAQATSPVEPLAMVGALSGCNMQLDLTDCFQADMACAAYQPELIHALQKLVQPSDIILTGGTHIGYILLHLGRLASSGQVIGFEADPRNIKTCATNIALNPHLNALLLPFAFGSNDGALPFWESAISAQSSFGLAHHADHQITIPIRRGDNALAEIGIDILDGLLLDVEGWEVQVLRGLDQTLKRHLPRWAVIECVDWALEAAGSSVEELRHTIESYGWKIVDELGADLVCLRR